MKLSTLLLVAACLIIPAFDVAGQVTNVVVNGSSTNFTMVSGDTIRWEFDLPVGEVAELEIWIDVNDDGNVQSAIDSRMATFLQRDGGPGSNGPPDMDGSANGHIVFYQRVGLAPADFIMLFTHNLTTVKITGTVQPLAAPAHTISGRVTPPAGKSPANILVELFASGDGNRFWQGLTDANGDFAIQMDADTSGNPWNISVSTNMSPAIVEPAEISIVITGNHAGNNFTFQQPAAQVAGYVRDEGGAPVRSREVQMWGETTHSRRWAQTDDAGWFQIGVTTPELVNQQWYLSVSTGEITSNEMRTERMVPALQLGDSIFYLLTIYPANAQISGTVLVNGVPPGFELEIIAMAGDTLESYSLSNAATGDFVLNVSDRVNSYQLGIANVPPNYSVPFTFAQPGQTGVIFPITVTSVGPDLSGVPDAFALHQNYPNPFNPLTTIGYDLAERSYVRVRIFNLLGQQIGVPVDRMEDAGFKRVDWNAGALTSGVYFCRMECTPLTSPSRTFTFVRKLILAK